MSKRTFYVSKTGNDVNNGLTADRSFATIGKAAQAATAGDTVLVSSGRYFENPAIVPMGQLNAPIIYKASQPGTVIISAADRNVLEKRTVWRAEPNGLYSIAYPGIPQRVLYDSDRYSNIDLYSYNEDKANRADISNPLGAVCLNDLQKKVRSLGITNAVSSGAPAPLLGFAYDQNTRRLYVRLSAEYGSSTDPNNRSNLVKIAPTGSSSANLKIALGGKALRNAYCILDGFIFEAGGRMGISLARSAVIIRNCAFYGCYSAIYSNLQDAVTVEYCEFTGFPAYDDAREVFSSLISEDQFTTQRNDFVYRNWWHRKTPYYEGGFLRGCGKSWKVLHNNIHDVFEGLNGQGVGTSTSMEVAYNRFERIVDNAIETEEGAKQLRFHHNIVTDVSSPISVQPQSTNLYPQSIDIYNNEIQQTENYVNAWAEDNLPTGIDQVTNKADYARNCHLGDVFKLMANFRAVGLRIYNNTIVLRTGSIFFNTAVTDVSFRNNLIRLSGTAMPTFHQGLQKSYITEILYPATGRTYIAAGEEPHYQQQIVSSKIADSAWQFDGNLFELNGEADSDLMAALWLISGSNASTYVGAVDPTSVDLKTLHGTGPNNELLSN